MNRLHLCWLTCCFSLTFLAAAEPLTVPARSRVQPFKGSDSWTEIAIDLKFQPNKTAVILCDIWDDHWCKAAANRCAEIAKKTETVVKELRKQGMFIIHCPSDTMNFYKDHPARKRMLEFPKVDLPTKQELPDPKCPVDDSDGGCDDPKPAKPYKAWSRQHAAIEIDADRDGITDNGLEVMYALKAKGIDTVLVAGVHTNMCVLHRSFAIKNLTRHGFKCVLIRDLTDSMYNPAMSPKVSHDQGTELIIQHIEKFWCPTILSKDLFKK